MLLYSYFLSVPGFLSSLIILPMLGSTFSYYFSLPLLFPSLYCFSLHRLSPHFTTLLNTFLILSAPFIPSLPLIFPSPPLHA